MKLSNLNEKQLEMIFYHNPDWIANNYEEWTIINHIEWMKKNRRRRLDFVLKSPSKFHYYDKEIPKAIKKFVVNNGIEFTMTKNEFINDKKHISHEAMFTYEAVFTYEGFYLNKKDKGLRKDILATIGISSTDITTFFITFDIINRDKINEIRIDGMVGLFDIYIKLQKLLKSEEEDCFKFNNDCILFKRLINDTIGLYEYYIIINAHNFHPYESIPKAICFRIPDLNKICDEINNILI